MVFAWLALHVAHVSPDLSFVRDTGLRLGLFFYVWVFIMIVASSNGVNLTDGLDGLAAGSSALVAVAAFVVIGVLGVPPLVRPVSDRLLRPRAQPRPGASSPRR